MTTTTISTLGRRMLDREMLAQGVRAAGRRLYWDNVSFGLKRDLQVPHTAPAALIEISVRPLEERDTRYILDPVDGESAEDGWARHRRRHLRDAGIGTCYAAVTADDEPCYVQWLFGHRDNDDVQRFFRGMFPVLDEETALVEDAFTPAAHRGKRIMSAAMASIAERAADLPARYVITFVGKDNAASLKGCARAGFSIYTERAQSVRLNRRTVEYRPVAPAAG